MMTVTFHTNDYNGAYGVGAKVMWDNQWLVYNHWKSVNSKEHALKWLNKLVAQNIPAESIVNSNDWIAVKSSQDK